MQGYTKLTEEQRQQFRDEGYLIVRNVLDDVSISRLIEAGDRIIAKEDRFNRFQTNGGLYDGYRNCITMDDAFIPLLTNGKSPCHWSFSCWDQILQLSTSHLIYRYPDPPGTPDTVRRPGWHRDNGRTQLDLGQGKYPRIGLKCAFYLTDLSQREIRRNAAGAWQQSTGGSY